MPRKSKLQQAQERFAELVASAVALLPFSPSHAPDAPERFSNLPVVQTLAEATATYSALSAEDAYAHAVETGDVRYGIARSIYADRKIGRLSGAALRMRYGGTNDASDGRNVGLHGHLRRDVLRAYGFGGAVAPSYLAFRDGDPRSGSGHASLHGSRAEERAAQAQAELDAAQAQQQAQDRKAESKRLRKTLRDAGITPERSDAKMRGQAAVYFASQVPATSDADAS